MTDRSERGKTEPARMKELNKPSAMGMEKEATARMWMECRDGRRG